MRRLLTVMMLAMWTVGAGMAHAEWTADLYAGAAFTNKTDLIRTSSLGLTATVQDLKVDPSFTDGERAGQWLEKLD